MSTNENTALTRLNVGTKLAEVKGRFTNVVTQSSDAYLNFEKEQGFAIQALNNNDTLMNAAINSPASLLNSVLNVALTGLSLNPVLKFAYLIPRKGRVLLEPSYIGLIKILTDAGIVKSIRAEIVRQNDDFDFQLGSKPFIRHSRNLASDNDSIIGAYAIAELADGLQQFEVMSKSDIDKIMERSESAKSNFSPWKSDYSEMARKTVIRRLYKYLPKSSIKAVDKLQAFEENDFDETVEISNVPKVFSNTVVNTQEPPKPQKAQPQRPVQTQATVVTVVQDDTDKENEVHSLVQVWKEQIEELQDIEDVERMSATIHSLREDVREKLIPIYNAHLKKLRTAQASNQQKQVQTQQKNNSSSQLRYGF